MSAGKVTVTDPNAAQALESLPAPTQRVSQETNKAHAIGVEVVSSLPGSKKIESLRGEQLFSAMKECDSSEFSELPTRLLMRAWNVLQSKELSPEEFFRTFGEDKCVVLLKYLLSQEKTDLGVFLFAEYEKYFDPGVLSQLSYAAKRDLAQHLLVKGTIQLEFIRLMGFENGDLNRFQEQIVSVQGKSIFEWTKWLEKKGLPDIFHAPSRESISPQVLHHASGEVVEDNFAISCPDYCFIRQQILTHLSHCQKTYANGSPWQVHGVAHATRAAYFTAVITELYLAFGLKLETPPKYLPIAGFVHDSGRERDDDEDLWDYASGRICSTIMQQYDELTPEQVKLLSKSISGKNKKVGKISLEQRIVHDADSMEIVRCLMNPESFDSKRLWMFKDQFPKPLLDLFVEEAKRLITLTERPEIKTFLQESQDPLRCLVQIIDSAKSFPFLTAVSLQTVEAFCGAGKYIPNPIFESRSV